uniref:E3 ubiquitin-protein ligase WAV3-like n=1 Tax=Erigeron canadensis TaxID=72917 RepID=UPI001CB9B2D7|nr:E3 ubiquitin-protein ligase WAV3-like [Erigeron canadensis]
MSGFQDTCSICSTSMKGQAIYTGECSHSFHFHCVYSNGNQICPVCLVKWKQVPPTFSPPPPPNYNSHFAAPFYRSVPPPPPIYNNPFAAPRFSFYNNNEPDVFDDDEALDVQSSSNNATDTTTDGLSFKRLLMETYTEVPAVPRLAAVDDFTVLVHLKAPDSISNQNSRAPVDLVMVLDISGSMSGTKLALVKRATGFVIQNLGAADRLSVIVFSDAASRLFPLTKMSDTGKQHALQAVNSLVATGGTNIADGLRMSGKVMQDRREKNPVASIMLLSDGQDTYDMRHSFVTGGTQNWSNNSIPVHAFGFGNDHDAKLMHSISERSRGTFSFIENERAIQDAFAQCIGGLLSVVVKGLEVGIESANPDILLRSLKAGSYKNQLMPDRKSGCIDVGDLYADEERDFLISVNIPKETTFTCLNETSLVKVNCHYTNPLTKEAVNLVSENATIKRPESVGEENVVSIKVDKQRNRLQSAEAMEQARKAAEENDLKRAVSILENVRKVLSESVSAKSGDPLCMALDSELKEMQDRMASRRTYEDSGRPFMLSGVNTHGLQRAMGSACGGTFGAAMGASYQTPAMLGMVAQSRADPYQPASSSFTFKPRPR